MDDDLKYVITEEERTRHDALFYSQTPKNGLLSGEQARSLFIRSRLPLSELSKIWKLADLTRDNMLDVSEFATAMHLIQLRLRGFDIPEKLPPSLTPTKINVINIPKITAQEMGIYQKTFEWKDKGKTGYIDTETACNIMLSTRLESHVLAQIWDMSDADRDAKLSNDEFVVALHLLRFCKKGNKLEGSIDVKSALPQELLKDGGEAKKKRHTEVQTERRQLWTLKQKLCSEMAGLDEKVVDEKIRPELNKVEEKLSILEKEETELRRSLLNLKDKSKKESFKPFDRSFLLKKRVSGSDLFKGDRQSYLGTKDGAVFEKLWSADSDNLVDDSEFSKKDQDSDHTPSYNGLGNDYSQTQPTDIIFTEVKREKQDEKDGKGLVNGVDSVDSSIRSGYRLDANLRLQSRGIENSSSKSNQENKKTERNEGKKVERNESFSWAAVQRRPVIQQTVTEEISTMPEKKGDVVEEVVSVEHKDRAANVDEQLKLLEKESSNHVDINQNSDPLIEHEVTVQSVKRLESSHQDLDNVFNQMSDDHSISNGTDNGHKKLPVGRVLSIEEEKELLESGALKRAERESLPRNEPTQEELLPMYLEERRKVEEQRRKKREVEEEKIRQAREELKRQEEENRQQLALRKVSMQEAKGKLEKQISQSEHIVPKADAGRLIEQELAEQRIRDEEARIRMEQFNKESMDEPKLADKGSKIQPKQLVIESSPPAKKPQFHPSVVRRHHPEQSAKPRSTSNRKSWVELEIEQQKLKDEEMRREREERQKDLGRLAQGQKQLHAVQRDIEMTEEPVKRTSQGSVESQPGISVMQTSQLFSKPPAKKAAPAPPRGVTKSSNKITSNAPVVNRNIQAKESIRSNTAARSLIDSVDGTMTADEAAMERRLQEEEERRRLEQIEKARQDCLIREAEELVRQKNIREEELRKKKEIHLREAEKIRKEDLERQEEAKRHAEHRRFKFETEKIRLEERVIRTMKESQMADTTSRARTSSSSSESSVQKVASPPPTDEEEVHEVRRSVRDAKALFERPQEQPKVVMRQKRQSLNLDDTATINKPSRNTNRASFYSDAIVSQEKKTTNAIQIIGLNDPVPEEKPSRLVLGDISSKRQQYETRPRSVEGNQQSVSGKGVNTQSLFSSTIANSKIQREMEELQRKEEEMRRRRDGFVRTPSHEQDSLDGIKKNPLPSKMQVKGAAPKAPTPKAPAPKAPVSKQEPQQKSASNTKPPAKKSFIEMEKERAQQREKALQREREAIMREREMILLQQKESEPIKDAGKRKPVTGGWQYK